MAIGKISINTTHHSGVCTTLHASQADCYNVFLYLQDQELLDEIWQRVGAESADYVQKLCSVLVVDCEVVELARAMWRDYNNERRQMAPQYLRMPPITRALVEVG